MTEAEAKASLAQTVWIASGFTALGLVLYAMLRGPRVAAAFAVAAAASFVNLWFFNWLSGSIAPQPERDLGESRKKRWPASLFIGRYAGLWLVGYATLKTLGVSAVPVLLGLLATTAALLVSSIIDAIRKPKRPSFS